MTDLVWGEELRLRHCSRVTSERGRQEPRSNFMRSAGAAVRGARRSLFLWCSEVDLLSLRGCSGGRSVGRVSALCSVRDVSRIEPRCGRRR